jgi:hypothetical protein
MDTIQQRVLTKDQVEQFYHDVFVTTQIKDFLGVMDEAGLPPCDVIDIGGGVGFFAEALAKASANRPEVVDMDPASVAACHKRGVCAIVGDALNPPPRSESSIVSFNLILHHLVGSSDAATLALQSRALSVWQGKARAIFVNEYIYDSAVGNASGWLIFQITSSQLLSAVGRLVARFVPSLQANTFGTGVRFRAHAEWVALFEGLGYRVAAYRRGPEENVSLARRMLLIKSCRRDSYLLMAAGAASAGAAAHAAKTAQGMN